MDLDEWPYPKTPLVPDRRERARADERGDLPRLHPRLPVLPGRDDHPPGARAEHRRASARWSTRACAPPATRRSGCCRCPAPTTPRSGSSPRSWPTATRAPRPACRLPSTRVDAFNVTLANELSRNGRRSGLTFAPEGGSERIRRVINKTVSKEDLVRTVTTAYANGWRQVKLYFMCGLPTETDEDVLEIADLAVEVIRAGREASGSQGHPLHRLDRRLRAQAAHPVPVGRAGQRRDDRPPAEAAPPEDQRRQAVRPLDRHALPRRQARRRRGPALPRRPPGRAGSSSGCGATAGSSTAGASTSPTSGGRRRPPRSCAPFGVDLDWFTTRERGRARGAALGPPGLRPGQGVALGGLAGRDLRARRSPTAAGPAATTAASARPWAPRSRSGPTGRSLLPLTRRC